MRYPDQLTVALALLGFAGCAREKGRADPVLRGGEVYTVDAVRSWASAVAVRDGRIVYVGSDSLPRGLIGPGTEIVELAGAMVLPGFQDAHVHPISSGVELDECHLHSLTTAAAVLDSIRACALARTDRPWVRGSGWQLPIFPGGNPSRVALDRVVPDRPALFYAADGHSVWLNSRALALPDITRHTPDPANGHIERDPRSGEPSGTLRESDLPRFRALGVVANFEALWANGDDYLTKLTEPALGPARSRWLYPIASVVRTGAIVTGGSDWSVSSLNPLEAIEVGITHRNPGDSIAAAWNPAERVDLPTMIALYTINAAWALNQEDGTGSIEAGKLADLVVLDRNLFQIPADRIHEAQVMRTLLEGKTVYEAGAHRQPPPR